MSDRAEVERIKAMMRRDDAKRERARQILDYFGSAQDRATARAELEAETPPAAEAEVGVSVPVVGDLSTEYLSLAEIEAERHRLAQAGRPHGLNSLERTFGKGSRSTIQRRYAGSPPPGTWIDGIREVAPTHAHAR